MFSKLMVNDEKMQPRFTNSIKVACTSLDSGQVSYAQSKMATCHSLIYNKIASLKFES